MGLVRRRITGGGVRVGTETLNPLYLQLILHHPSLSIRTFKSGTNPSCLSLSLKLERTLNSMMPRYG